VQRRALVSLALLACGCGLAPPLDPHLVRVLASGQVVVPADATLFAREDEREGRGRGITDLEGDPLRLGRDIRLRPGLGAELALDVSPTDDDELGASARLLPELRGTRRLRRTRRFDSEPYEAGERVETTLDGSTIRLQWSRRVLAPRGLVDADLRLRLGYERDDLGAELRGEESPDEARQVRVGAPWIGAEARIALLDDPDLIAHVGVDGGYWNVDGVRLALVDASAGARVRVAGPLFADVSYRLSWRDARANLERGEVSRIGLLDHAVSVGFGLEF
jgi:hypothetical protein